MSSDQPACRFRHPCPSGRESTRRQIAGTTGAERGKCGMTMTRHVKTGRPRLHLSRCWRTWRHGEDLGNLIGPRGITTNADRRRGQARCVSAVRRERAKQRRLRQPRFCPGVTRDTRADGVRSRRFGRSGLGAAGWKKRRWPSLRWIGWATETAKVPGVFWHELRNLLLSAEPPGAHRRAP